MRQRKDGSLVDISLSVSPISGRTGHVIGASKIARDITERRRAEEQQHLLIQEMNHRVKNLFTVASSIVSLSARTTTTSAELAAAVRDRLGALSRAHMLTVPPTSAEADRLAQTATLHSLIKTNLTPYGQSAASHAIVSGPDIVITGGSLTSFALLLHEFSTNAAKYGALSTEQGGLKFHVKATVSCSLSCGLRKVGRLCTERPTGKVSAQFAVAQPLVANWAEKFTVNGNLTVWSSG